MSGVLRREMGFEGLIYTDSMGMAGVTQIYKPGEAAVRAIKAGNDVVLHSPDDGAAFAGIKAAVQSGEISQAQIDKSVERILRAKVFAGLHRIRAVDLDALANIVGGRAHQAVADEVSQKIDHAGAGSAQPGAAEAAARRADTVSVDPRFAGGLADRGAEPDVHSRVEAALAQRDVGRAVRALHGQRGRAGARDGAALRRDRRVGVRAGRVGQRPDGSAGEHAGAAARASRG